MTPWLVLILLLGNFIMMAFDAREITSGQRVIRIWTQAAADFVQSPVTTVSSGVTGYFSSIANLRSAQGENDQFADGARIRASRAMGYVNDAFGSDTLAGLTGHIAVGHVRYSTAGESRLANAQPIVIDSAHGGSRRWRDARTLCR